MPRVRTEDMGAPRPERVWSVAAYWADGWELRQLDWLRWHGFWTPG
jgi:hypothetical protein